MGGCNIPDADVRMGPFGVPYRHGRHRQRARQEPVGGSNDGPTILSVLSLGRGMYMNALSRPDGYRPQQVAIVRIQN